jgi:hypothetical protein
MTKIILGYEKINKQTSEGFRFNGRINPSLIPVSLTDYSASSNDEGSKSFIQQSIIFNCFPDQDSTLHVTLGLNSNSSMYEIKEISEIGSEETYFYPIHMLSIHTYIKYTSHIAVSDKVLNDAKNRKCFIVLSYPYEGNLYYRKHNLSLLIEKLGIPKENILVLHADNNSENFLDCPFTYVPINLFPWWVEYFSDVDDIVEYKHERLFSCFNRRMRVDRLQLLSYLKRGNLINDGFISCGDVNEQDLSRIDSTDSEKLFLKNLEGSSPDNLIISGPAKVNPAMNVNFEIASRTFLTVVPETETRTNNILYFTEKTFKPILMGHPFIIYGGLHSLKKLKEFGYKTFDKWWDESYDDTVNFVDNANKITQILLSLKSKSLSELKIIRDDMSETLRYNQTLFLNTIRNKSPDDTFIDTLRKFV